MRLNFSFLYRLFIIVIFFLGLFYLLPYSPSFPIAPPDAVQSLEEADTEYIYRRAYFTNYSREDVMKHYENAFGKVKIFGVEIPSFRLNYPPEEAYTLIRDQTRSTFLEEIVHPFRESIYVNGFKPKVAKDDIWYKGVHYEQKITVRYVPSDRNVRVLVLSLGIILFLTVFKEFLSSLVKFVKEIV